MSPSHIGRYEVQRRLGGGGMGSLYLGHDPKLKRLVAIKLLNEDVRDNDELRERFAREAESVARLRHPNIVVVFDVGEDETGHPFMAMEYIAGETLKLILQPPSIPLAKRLGLVEDLCAGLAHAHAAGIVHRDIKPENIMLDGDGVLKIVDFGIARQANSGMTQDGMMLGTYNYMSPEQMAASPVDQRSDIFAVGAVLYECVSLQRAFPGAFPEAYHRILTAGPIPLERLVPSVDPDLSRIVHRALERDPDRRYQHVSALRQELTQVRRRLAASPHESGERPAYEATQIFRPPKTTPPDTRRQADNKRLAQVRRQQVDEHIRLAQEASQRGDHEAALQHAERAASVDPDSRVAFDLIDNARLAIDTKAVLKMLREATQLLAAGRVDEASGMAEQASAAVPDLPGADGLRQEVRYVLDEIRAAREREVRIQASLQRARESLDKAGFETALRAVYEVLALDPDRKEALDLEHRAKERLDAQRQQERLTRDAYNRLQSARALASDGKFDEAMNAIAEVTPPSATVRQAVADALSEIKRLQHEAMVKAAVSAAAEALSEGRPEQAISRVDAIDTADQTDQARSIRAAATAELERRREMARKQQALDDAIAAARGFVTAGDVIRAQVSLRDAAGVGLEDERLDVLRRDIAQLVAAAEAKQREEQARQREEAQVRLAAAQVEEARRLHADGDTDAAVRVLENADANREVVRVALIQLRAERDERLRRDAERREQEEAERRSRQEEERKKKAELEAARKKEEQRQEEERRLVAERQRLEAERERQEVQRQRVEADRQRQEVERQQREEALRKRAEIEAAQRQEEESRAHERRRLEAEQKARVEAEQTARVEAERKERVEAEHKARVEAEQKARVEAERKARAEAEQKARAEAERRRREEEERREQRRRTEEARAQEETRRAEEERADQQAAVTQIRAKSVVSEDAQTISRSIEDVHPATEIRTPPPPVSPVVTPSEHPPSKTLIAAAAALVVIGGGIGAYYFLRSPDVGIEVRVSTSVPVVVTVPPTVQTPVQGTSSINGVSTAMTSAPTTIPRLTTQSTIAPQPSTVVTSTPVTIAPTTAPVTSAPTTAPVTSVLTSAPTTIPVRVQADPKEAVSQLLDQYASAYTQRDFQALRRVWPAAPAAVNSTFASVQRYELALESCDIRLMGADRAEATCLARTTVVPLRGGQTQRGTASRLITLRRQGEGWLIESVGAR